MEMKKVLLSRAEEEAGVGGREARVDGGHGSRARTNTTTGP
jgi:hypothetical protein